MRILSMPEKLGLLCRRRGLLRVYRHVVGMTEPNDIQWLRVVAVMRMGLGRSTDYARTFHKATTPLLIRNLVVCPPAVWMYLSILLAVPPPYGRRRGGVCGAPLCGCGLGCCRMPPAVSFLSLCMRLAARRGASSILTRRLRGPGLMFWLWMFHDLPVRRVCPRPLHAYSSPSVTYYTQALAYVKRRGAVS